METIRLVFRVKHFSNLAAVQNLHTLLRVTTATRAREQSNYCIAKALGVTSNNIYGT